MAFMPGSKIYPSIVTTDGKYEEKLEEINRIGLEEVCFFPTAISPQERKKFYPLLEKSKIRKIPLVHLKDDFRAWEIEYFLKNFQTEAFNTHTAKQYPIPQELLKYRKIIYIENTIYAWEKEEIEDFAGICIDFSHLEDARLLRKEIYKKNLKVIEQYPSACAHISAVPETLSYSKEWNLEFYGKHFFRDLTEFDYLKNYPPKHFPKILSLELESSIEEQIRVKEYLGKILKI